MNTDDEISLRSLQDLDLSNIDAPNMTYDLELNTVGHENDKQIAQLLDVALTFAGMVYSKANVAAKAIGKKGSQEVIKKGVKKSTFSHINKKLLREAAEKTLKIKTVGSLSQASESKESENNEKDNNSLDNIFKSAIEFIKPGGGLLEDIVGGATDVMIAKPMRKRLIRNYIDYYIAPQFKSELYNIRKQLTSLIGDALHIEATETINQRTSSLEQLQNERKEKHDAYESTIKQLKNNKNE